METLLGLIILGLFINFLSNRIEASLPRIARWFANLAARLVPKAERERFREEWRAYVDDLSGSAKFWQALQLPYVAVANSLARLLHGLTHTFSFVVTFFKLPPAIQVSFIQLVLFIPSMKFAFSAYTTLGLKWVDRKYKLPLYCRNVSIKAACKFVRNLESLLKLVEKKCPDADIGKLRKEMYDVIVGLQKVLLIE